MGEMFWSWVVVMSVLIDKCYIKFIYVNLMFVIDGCVVVVWFGF